MFSVHQAEMMHPGGVLLELKYLGRNRSLNGTHTQKKTQNKDVQFDELSHNKPPHVLIFHGEKENMASLPQTPSVLLPHLRSLAL